MKPIALMFALLLSLSCRAFDIESSAQAAADQDEQWPDEVLYGRHAGSGCAWAGRFAELYRNRRNLLLRNEPVPGDLHIQIRDLERELKGLGTL